MASFIPNLPANNSPTSSAELRTQLNALNERIDAVPTLDQLIPAMDSESSGPANGVEQFTLTISNPPTQAQVQAVVNNVNEIPGHLQRL